MEINELSLSSTTKVTRTQPNGIRGRPFNPLKGVERGTRGGGWGVGDFEKKFLQALVGRKKMHAAQKKSKKILALLQARKKKMLQSYFIIPGGLHKIPAKLLPFRIICKPASHSG